MATLRQRWDDFISFSQQLIEQLYLDEYGCSRGGPGATPDRTGNDPRKLQS